MTTNEYFRRKEKAIEMYEQGHPVEEISLTVGLTVLALEGLFENHEKDKADENEYMERAEKAIEMYKQGCSIAEISKTVEFHPSLLMRLFDGRKSGIAIGKAISTRNIIENMLRKKLPIEEIMDYTGATRELVEEIGNEKGEKMTKSEYVERARKAIEMYEEGSYSVEQISDAVGLCPSLVMLLFENYETGRREERSMVMQLCAAFRKGLPLDTIADEFGMELSKIQEIYEQYLVEMSKEGGL